MPCQNLVFHVIMIFYYSLACYLKDWGIECFVINEFPLRIIYKVWIYREKRWKYANSIIINAQIVYKINRTRFYFKIASNCIDHLMISAVWNDAWYYEKKIDEMILENIKNCFQYEFSLIYQSIAFISYADDHKNWMAFQP